MPFLSYSTKAAKRRHSHQTSDKIRPALQTTNGNNWSNRRLIFKLTEFASTLKVVKIRVDVGLCKKTKTLHRLMCVRACTDGCVLEYLCVPPCFILRDAKDLLLVMCMLVLFREMTK